MIQSLQSKELTSITRGGKRDEAWKQRCEMVSSHTARRTFASNAYRAGVPAMVIMKITGHRTETQFLKYIKITNDEAAKIMQKIWITPLQKVS